MPNQVNVRVGTSGVGKASSELDSLRDKFDRLQKQGAKGFAIGAGAAITAKGLSILDTALSGTVNLMGDAVQAGVEEEQSLHKLDAALRANVKGWNGNTDAIEEVLQSRMKLGFADDEQRESLALLVVATKDHNKALDLQRTAMDLARLKGISLKEASEALIRVEGGQFRLLKSLGIELKNNATQQDALNAVQAVAQGQAEAFAETTGGKLLAAQVKVGESMEHLGTVALPLVADGAEALAHTIEGLVGWLDLLGDAAAPSDNFAAARDNLMATADAAEDGSRAFGGFKKDLHGVEPLLRGVGDALDGGSGSVTSASYEARKAVEDLEEAFEDLEDAAYDAAKAFGDQGYSSDELKGRLAELEEQLFEAKRELLELEAIKNPTADQQRDIVIARGKVAGYRHDIFDTRIELAKLDDTTLAGLLTELSKAQYRTDVLGDEAREALSLFQKLAFAEKKVTGFKGDPGYAPRADGGPVTANKPYLVGEEGPEVFVPGASGQIIPNGGSGGGGGSWGGIMFAPTVVIQGVATPATVAAIVNDLGPAFADYMTRSGWAPR